MLFSTSNIALAAAYLLLCARQAAAIDYNTTTYVNCYSSVPGYIDNGTYTYQSTGYCQHRCVPMGYSVMALLDGNGCYCGNELPPNSTQVDTCDVACDGYAQDTCGGKSAYGVWLTGVTSTVAVMADTDATSSSSSSSTTTSGVTVVTKAGETIVVTASSSASSKSSGSSSTSTAGIAAGVVVGVVGLASIIGASLFFLRRRQKRRVEDEYRRNAEINAFTQKPSSLSSDPRWDADYMAQRRQSNGSIADDQDFSRRILQVTNPDR